MQLSSFKKFKSQKYNTNFKLNSFLITTMTNYNLYLGYARNQLNTKMAFNLLGSRVNLDIHKLTLTYYAIKKMILICKNIWINFSMLWVVSPKNPYITYLLKNLNKTLNATSKNLLFWLDPWLPGFFNNTLGFVKLKKKLVYPAGLFYLQYTNNIDRIQEAKLRGILHFNVVDTNSPCVGDYPINSNETSASSNIYYSKILLNSCLLQKKLKKKQFII